jgi:hypothetical protein
MPSRRHNQSGYRVVIPLSVGMFYVKIHAAGGRIILGTFTAV